MSIPDKPRFGSPCNGCGICCAVEVCQVGIAVLGEIAAPCPAMRFADDRFYCGLVLLEQSAREQSPDLEPFFFNVLGIGKGCDAEDL